MTYVRTIGKYDKKYKYGSKRVNGKVRSIYHGKADASAKSYTINSIDNLYFENKEQIITQINTALSNGKHIILIGPPGTGKSKLSKEICILSRKKYTMSTATSDWSTFDTIGGYRQNKKGELEFSPGIFLQCLKDKKWLIIDEINRADIDKAFGSLFSALTGDDITLPFEINGKCIKIIGNPDSKIETKENHFIIPKDWRIIATMNTFDKSSLYEMSYAFMRRFAFIQVGIPTKIEPETIKRYTEIWKLDTKENIHSNLSELWNKINKHRKIGPAIIEDICKYIINAKDKQDDYTNPITMYVFPQFEGLLEEEQITFIKDMISLKFIKEEDYLKESASEFFGINIRKFTNENSNR